MKKTLNYHSEKDMDVFLVLPVFFMTLLDLTSGIKGFNMLSTSLRFLTPTSCIIAQFHSVIDIMMAFSYSSLSSESIVSRFDNNDKNNGFCVYVAISY